MQQFVHLHNHSHYSLLDGATQINDMIARAVEFKMPALALTDHGVLFGAIEFYKSAKKAGIKPIIGCEMYVAKGKRNEKNEYNHLTVLAKNYTGYKNLIKLVSIAHLEGYYYKPRVDFDLLSENHDGLIVLSGCLSSPVSEPIVNGDIESGRKAALKYKDVFGEDYYLEVHSHGLDEEKRVLASVPKIAREIGVKMVAVNDGHYLRKEHAIPHNILLNISQSSNGTKDPTELRYKVPEFYFKSQEEMERAFADYDFGPGAIENTLEVADKCDLKLELKKDLMPRFPIPADAGVSSPEDYFEKLAYDGLTKRYGEISPDIRKRFDHEIVVIKKMGFAGYFLVVQDFINSAREMGVRVGPGRGSAAGSIVSYALGITNVDPLKYGLLFERFLNPDRVSMPDIDIDFADNKRNLVIDYVKRKYGEESVCQIVTFGTLSSRAVLKDVGRVLGISLSTTESITKQIPVILGRVTPLREAVDTIPELRWVKESNDPKIKQLIEYSLVLEGTNRNVGTHAAGVVIAPGKITDYVPLYKTPSTEVITEYEYKSLEEIGLLKMDFLGLRTLTVIEDALRRIKENHGKEIDLDGIPYDDPKVYELFAAGQTVAVFQFESSKMQEYLKKLNPTSMDDVVAMNALYRPGPMEMIEDFIDRKIGRKPIEYLHPKMEQILKPTYGVMVYQEQVIQIASAIAGFTLAQADMMRRAMGKKDKILMAEQKKLFVEGAIKNSIDRKLAGEIFDLIDKFASYGFNKSHAVAYSVLAYQTAYLKTYYPPEFMAAALTSEIGDLNKTTLLLAECRKLGITVLGPDVNESLADFSVTEGKLRFGLSAIKNVGVGAAEEIIRSRNDGGKFENIFDFVSRVDMKSVNKRALESLVQAGAFDSMGHRRAQLYNSFETISQFGQSIQESKSSSQSSLFDILGADQKKLVNYPSLSMVEEWSQGEKLNREKELIGVYISGHPLLRFEQEYNSFTNVRLGDSSSIVEGMSAKAAGIVVDVRRKIDKKGNTMAFVQLEDFTGKGDVIFFSDAYSKYQGVLFADSIVLVSGKAESNGDSVRIMANEAISMEEAAGKLTKSIAVSIDRSDNSKEGLVSLKEMLGNYSTGNCSIFFSVNSENGKPKIFRSNKSVDPNRKFVDALFGLFGKENVRLIS
ncbi:MAG TPA: DNA polymerase III subunit alpha [Candidatus Acidoferrales bacterium]|nr:DNA polymerase III subunit alpha [Candidatus Acidoferrales bacterium]